MDRLRLELLGHLVRFKIEMGHKKAWAMLTKKKGMGLNASSVIDVVQHSSIFLMEKKA